MDSSRAAIIAPSRPPRDAPPLGELLDQGLRAHRYVPHAVPLPRGYRPADREWLAFDLREADQGRLLVLACEHVGLVFQVALWLAAAAPDTALLAWRQLRDSPPVFKVYGGGRPIYRVGPDRDLELGWNLPPRPPADRRGAAEMGLPATHEALQEVAGPSLAPYPRRGAPALGTRMTYLRRNSPLVHTL